VRDPRDVFLSYSRRARIADESGTDVARLLADFIAEWGVQVSQVLALRKQGLPVLLVRYEDLIANLCESMQAVADFLGLNWSDTLLEPTRHGKPWGGNSVFTDDFEGVSASPVGRYKSGLGEDVITMIESALSTEMQQLGYAAGEGRARVTLPVQLRLLVRRAAYHARYRLKRLYLAVRA
jgi:hypothetical protein